MEQALAWAALGTGFTFLMTTLGAAAVFLFRGRNSALAQRVFLGFAAGVMIAASVWSLLIPAIERAEDAGQIGWLPRSFPTCTRARSTRKDCRAAGSAPRCCSPR